MLIPHHTARAILRSLLLCLPLAASAQSTAPLLTPRDLMALPVAAPDHVIAYGKERSQFGELRVPAGAGPHPVVVLIHGGCFREEFAGAKSIGSIADALKAEGIASWNIEYRRLPEPGSGWPGTYQDVAAGVDHLASLAPRFKLDLQRVVFLGHSAGAHLAHWAAGRGKLGRDSELFQANPLKPAGVINLAGRFDMAVDIEPYEALCRAPVIRNLLGGMPSEVSARYAQVSIPKLLPLGVRQALIWGSLENFVAESLARDYVSAARASGDDAELILIPGAGHFESASPKTAAWPVVLKTIRSMFEPRKSSAN